MSLHVKFAPNLVPLVQDGSKTATWRCFSDKPFETDRALGLCDNGGKLFGVARIGWVGVKAFCQMTPEDQQGHETYPTPQEMIGTFRGYYGDAVTPDTPVTIVKYTLQDLVIIGKGGDVTVISGDDDWIWERAAMGHPLPDFEFVSVANA